MITVLIADDHPIVRQGMQMLLEVQDDIDIVGVVENGAAAVALAEEKQPAVALLDLNRVDLLDELERSLALQYWLLLLLHWGQVPWGVGG